MSLVAEVVYDLISLMSTERERETPYKAGSTSRGPCRSQSCRSNHLNCSCARLTFVKTSHLFEGITKMAGFWESTVTCSCCVAYLIFPEGEVGK